jgi:hypothetical protein
MIEAAGTSETLVNFYQTTWRTNPEDGLLHQLSLFGFLWFAALFLEDAETVPQNRPHLLYPKTIHHPTLSHSKLCMFVGWYSMTNQQNNQVAIKMQLMMAACRVAFEDGHREMAQ